MQDGAVEWMDRVRKTVDAIMVIVDRDGQISLGKAKEIADSKGCMFHNALAELSARCGVDYSKGVITCKK